jgi:hypothetical protein
MAGARGRRCRPVLLGHDQPVWPLVRRAKFDAGLVMNAGDRLFEGRKYLAAVLGNRKAVTTTTTLISAPPLLGPSAVQCSRPRAGHGHSHPLSHACLMFMRRMRCWTPDVPPDQHCRRRGLRPRGRIHLPSTLAHGLRKTSSWEHSWHYLREIACRWGVSGVDGKPEVNIP